MPSLAGTVERRIAAQRAQVRNAAAVAVARFAVQKRLPLEKALTNAALGTNLIHSILATAGIKISRRTVHTRLAELYDSPVGEMPAHLHEAAPDISFKVWWKGANTYNLRNDRTKQGMRLLLRIRDLIAAYARTGSGVGGSSPSPLGPRRLRANRLDRRVSGALDWAVGHAEGRRNNLGNWLAWRCRSLGLAQHDVEEVMERYQREVCGLGSHPYTRREATATMRSVFRRGMALAEDPGPTSTGASTRTVRFVWS